MPETAPTSLQYDTLCVRRLGLTRDPPLFQHGEAVPAIEIPTPSVEQQSGDALRSHRPV
jgi:hypothetical protein